MQKVESQNRFLSIKSAINVLDAGGVIAYPTEAVWGLGCDPYDFSAVAKILALKKRSIDKGLILVASELNQLGALLQPLSLQQIEKLAQHYDVPTTWLIPNNSCVPPWITGKHSKVAIRISKNETVKALCNKYGGMIVSTSANPSGLPEATNALKVRAYFSTAIDYYVQGETDHFKQPSQIIDLDSGRVLR